MNECRYVEIYPIFKCLYLGRLEMPKNSPAQKGLRSRKIFFADFKNLAISERNEHWLMSKKSFLVVENVKTKKFPNLIKIFLPSVFPCFLCFYISTFLTLIRPGGGKFALPNFFFEKIEVFLIGTNFRKKIFPDRWGSKLPLFGWWYKLWCVKIDKSWFLVFLCRLQGNRWSDQKSDLIHFCRELKGLSNGVVEDCRNSQIRHKKQGFSQFLSKKNRPRSKKRLIAAKICIWWQTSFRWLLKSIKLPI